MGGKIYDVVWVSIHTTCGMNAHLYHIVGLSMLVEVYGIWICQHCLCPVHVRMMAPAEQKQHSGKFHALLQAAGRALFWP